MFRARRPGASAAKAASPPLQVLSRGLAALSTLLALGAAAVAQPRPCLVAYEVAVPLPGRPDNSDVRAQLLAADGSLPWGPAGIPVAAGGDYERRPCVVSDGAGGAVVVLEYKHGDGPRRGQVDLCAQRVSAEGKRLWNLGRPLALASTRYREHSAVAIGDGEGGVVVAYLVDVPAQDGHVHTGVCAQRIDGHGRLRWQEGLRSVVLQEGDCRCADLSIAASGDGGAYVAYRRVGTVAGGHTGGQIVLRRLSAAGNRDWEAVHPLGLTVSGELETPRTPVLVAGPSGSVWVAFQAGPAAAGGVYACRVSQDGVIARDGLPLHLSAGLVGQVEAVRAVPDGAGGLLCAFGLLAPGSPAKLHSARIAADGHLPWAAVTPLLPGAGQSYRELSALQGPQGSVTLALTAPVHTRHEADQHRALAAQRVGPDGRPSWGSSPVEVTTPRDGSVLTPGLAPDGTGGVYVIYVLKTKYGRLAGDTGIFGLRLTAAGRRAWSAPAPVATGHGRETAPAVVSG